jgi:hypothetical protein
VFIAGGQKQQQQPNDDVERGTGEDYVSANNRPYPNAND